jgi:hypothetical protein
VPLPGPIIPPVVPKIPNKPAGARSWVPGQGVGFDPEKPGARPDEHRPRLYEPTAPPFNPDEPHIMDAPNDNPGIVPPWLGGDKPPATTPPAATPEPQNPGIVPPWLGGKRPPATNPG